MKITIVSVRSMPWEIEGRTGVAVRADAIVELNGVARVCRIKLPRRLAQLQPGAYEALPRAYVDDKGYLSFALGEMKSIRREA